MKLNLYKPISCKWIFLFVSILLGGCLEQVNGQSLSSLSNSYRDGDWLDKVQVSFNEQVVGEKYVWTIAKVKDKSLPPDSYRILNDTVCCTRRGVRTYFYQNAQNISIIGYESNQFLIKYDKPEIYLHFPTVVGSFVDGDFSGCGMYCDKMRLWHTGSYHTEALKKGCLVTEEGDTIDNVLLLYTKKANHIKLDSLQCTQSSVFYEQVFRWYADGYRYPIMYRRIVSVSPKEDAATTSVTYLYSHQCKENLSVFEEKGIIKENRSSSQGEFSYQAMLSGKTIEVECYLTSRMTVKALLVDSKGCLCKSVSKNCDDGSRFYVDCNSLPMGQYILYLEVNGKKYSKNFLIK